MQSFTESVSSPFWASAFFSRLLGYFRSASVAQRPAIRWGDMKPIDFQGEDTSLTQEQLEVLR